MAFAGSRWAEEVDSLTPLDKAELCEGEDPILVERWLEGEVEAGQRLDRRKPPHPQRGLDTAILAQRQLLGEQDVDGFQCGEFAMLQATNNVIESLERTGHLQADEIVPNAIDH